MTSTQRRTSGRIARLGGHRLAAAVAIAAVLTLPACGRATVGAAAVVGDRRISVAQVQTATTQIEQIVAQGSAVDETVVLDWLIISPFAVDVAARNHAGASTDDAAQIFAQAAAANHFTGKPDPAALEAVRAVLALKNLQGGGGAAITQAQAQAAYDELVARIKAADIVVNPRYGTFHPEQVTVAVLAQARLPVVREQPDWQVPGATASPTPAPSAP